MSKIKDTEMVKMAKHIEQNRWTMYWNNYNYYGHMGGNCGLVHADGCQSFDCNNFVKSLINKPSIAYSTIPWDYAVPNTVIPDVSEWGLLSLCEDITWWDFSNCVPAEVLYMTGHIGLFVGLYNDPSGTVNVIEATAAMGGGVLSSYVDANGYRYDHKGGTCLGRWEAHGKLRAYIDYEETPSDKIKEDGEWGVETTKLAQKVFGTEIDGIVSNQPKALKKYCLNCLTESWEFNNSGGYSPLIVAIQKWVGAEADGQFGPYTIMALQRKLGVEVDGYCGPVTVKAFQKYLNSKA